MSIVANPAERRLEEFLSTLPAHKRKAFELAPYPDLTIEEAGLYLEDLCGNPQAYDALNREYIELLECVPSKAKQYRKRARDLCGVLASLMPMPRVSRGRPTSEAEAQEMAALENSGLSHRETANYLNDKYAAEIQAGKMTKRTPDNVRKLISRYYQHLDR